MMYNVITKPKSKIGPKLTMQVEHANQSHARLMICHLPFF